MRNTLIRTAVLALGLGSGTTAAADYRLTLTDTGLREYYCTITVTLTNETDAPLTEVNGFFLSFVEDEQVGRSKGSSFMNVPPGGAVSATFETPNAPCDEVTRYDFVIGACRLGSGFEDHSVCAGRMAMEPPFGSAAGL
ncbi:hypothetical protein [Pontivivens ytuae]|uniref:Uncharacterized protein n=1 Tax=Pontivivens ytuae TaxID=2789856 RepID=A0A7S9LUS6_9RHOB|nr:hypothetical protein [Pontivivens ytuae]QPH55634.1 hypothetical protein I0K15_07875 [Pontivivens ytuae]